MNISGINKFTTINYPGKMSCVLFAKGCSLHCKYCYNKILLKEPSINIEEIKDFLSSRKGKLEAVVFSGGEPMMQYKKLKQAVIFAKSLGYKVGLHLTGLNSDKKEFKEIIDLVDWVGLDYKAPEEKYKAICGLDYKFFLQALKIIQDSGIDFEIRTTLDEDLTKEDLLEMEEFLLSHNINTWYLQRLMIEEGIINIPNYTLDDFKINIIIR